MNKSLAAHYLKLSADQGNANGQSWYGKLLFKGEAPECSETI
jgi:TPR repeat protein